MCRRMWSSSISAIKPFTPPRMAAKHQDVRAFIPGGERALDSRELDTDALDAEQLLLFPF